MNPQTAPRRHVDPCRPDMARAVDPLPPTPPGEDGETPPWAWVGSGWTVGTGLVIALGLLWARAQGWL